MLVILSAVGNPVVEEVLNDRDHLGDVVGCFRVILYFFDLQGVQDLQKKPRYKER